MDLETLKQRQEERKRAQEEEEKQWEEERDRRRREREERRKKRFADLGIASGGSSTKTSDKKKEEDEEKEKKEKEKKKKEEEERKKEAERKKEEERKKEAERKRKEEEEQKRKEEKAKAAAGGKKEEKKEEKAGGKKKVEEESEINTSDISLDLNSSEDEGVFDEEEDEEELEKRKEREEKEEKERKAKEEKEKKAKEEREKKAKEEKERKEKEEKEKKAKEAEKKVEKKEEKEEDVDSDDINTSDISLDLSTDEDDDEVFDEDEDEDEKKEKEERERKAKEEKERKEKEEKEKKEKEKEKEKQNEEGDEENLSIEEQLRRRREAREKEREERERKRKEDRERMRREQMAALEEQLGSSDKDKDKEKKQREDNEKKEKEEKEKKEKAEKEKEKEHQRQQQQQLKRSFQLDETDDEREERERREAREREREERRKLRDLKRLANRQQMELIMAQSAPENVQKRKEEERMKLLKQLEEEDEMYKKDRPVPSVAFPNRILLTREDLFTKEGDVHTDVLLQHLVSEGRLELECCHHLLKKATDILYSEPTLLDLEAPFYLVGDIHGQFYDLLNLFKLLGGEPSPDRKYLFLGDYVDRGCFATEIVLYLYALKIKFPTSVYLLRGNHECRVITQHFNFHKECIYKYTDGVYQAFMTSFDSLPIAALIKNNDGKVLALHAGIGPTIRELDHLKEIMRYKEPPETGPLCDALWADPSNEDEVEDEEYSLADIQEWQDDGFSDNGLRGCSYVYGHKALAAFLQKNDLLSLIRGHSVKKLGAHEHTYFYPCKTTQDIPKLRAKRFEEGGREGEKGKEEGEKGKEVVAPVSPRAKDDSMPTPRASDKAKPAPATPSAPVKPLEIPDRPGPNGSDDPKERYPPCITVFSAPNYCDKYKNYGAALHFKQENYEIITQKEWEAHPYYLPAFQNAFDFSLPHLARMATSFLSSFLEALSGEGEELLPNAEVVQKTTQIFTKQTEDVKRGLKPSNIQSKYEQNLQKFEEILSKEGGNEQRPTTADWKSLNKTYSSPNLMKMFKRNDLMGREGGTLASRNALHRVASVRLPRMGDIQKSHNRGDIREFAKTLGEQQPQNKQNKQPQQITQAQSQPPTTEHKKAGLKLSKSISPRFPRSKSPRHSDGNLQEEKGSENKGSEKGGGKGGLFKRRREKSKRNLSQSVVKEGNKTKIK